MQRVYCCKQGPFVLLPHPYWSKMASCTIGIFLFHDTANNVDLLLFNDAGICFH